MENQLIVKAIGHVIEGMKGRDSVPVQEIFGAVLIELPASETETEAGGRTAFEDKLGSTLMAWLGTHGLGWHQDIQASDLNDLATHWARSFEVQTTTGDNGGRSDTGADTSRNAARDAETEAPRMSDFAETTWERAPRDSDDFGKNAFHRSSRRDDSNGGGYSAGRGDSRF